MMDNMKNKRIKLLDQGVYLFMTQGYHAKGINQIVKEVQVPTGSFYSYFKSKEDLFEAVVKKEADELSIQLAKRVINVNDNPKEKIRNYVLIRMRYLNEMVNFFETLKNDYLGNLAFTERIRKKYDKEEQQMLNKMLEEGVNQGIFKVRNTKFAALVLVTFLKGLESSLLINEDMNIDDLESNLDEILQIVFYGLVK